MFRRVLPWVGWTLLVVASLAGIWTWYIYSQRLLLDEDNRREIAHAARDLQTIVSGLSSSAKKFFEERENAQPEFLREFARRNPYIRRDTLIPENVEPTDSSFCPNLTPRQLDLWNTAKDYPLKLAINTEAIFDDVAISDAFEYLFIADANGKIMFAMDHGAASRRREGLGWIDRQAREHPDHEHSVIGLSDLQGLVTLDRKPLDPAALAQASGMRWIRLGEDEYQFFSYPFTPEPPEGCGETKSTAWIVGGLVSPARVWREAATISPRWTLLLLLLFLLVVAAQPFVKVHLLGPMERYRFADGCMVLPSAAFLLMAATVLLLEDGAHARLKSAASGSLERLSQRVEERMTDEFSRMREQLLAFDDQLVEEVKHRGCEEGLPRLDISDLLEGTPRADAVGRPDLYPALDQVAWMDSSGKQIFKATVHPAVTPRLQLPTRAYFKEVRDGRLWSLQGDDRKNSRFFVQSSRSVTTADLFTELSIPSRLGERCRAPDKPGDVDVRHPFVAVISAKPIWVERPLLAPGNDFAVIAADGQVLYHSDARRTAKEDFFEEVEDPAALRAAIQAGAPLHLTTTYARRRVELFIRPLKSLQNAGWFIVTLRDERWLEGLSTEVLVRTMIWSLLPWLLSLAVAVIGRLLGNKSLRYWWPDPKKEGLYRVLAFVCWVTLVAGIICVSCLDPGGVWLFRLSLAFPFVLAAATLVVYGAWSLQARGLPGHAYKAWYLAALAGIWAASAVVPAVGLFRHSWHLDWEKLGRLQQLREDRHQRDWRAQDEDSQRYLKIRDRSEFLDVRECQRPRYVEALSDPATGEIQSRWDQRLDRLLPIYSEAVEWVRYQEPARQALPVRSNQELPAPRRAGMAFIIIPIFGFTLVALAASLYLRYHARNVFWTHLMARCQASTPAELIAGQSFVILLAPSPRERRGLAAALTPLESPAMVSAGSASTRAGSGVAPLVVVDFEDARLEDSARQTALARLEMAAAPGGGGAVILANSDPLRLFSGQPLDEGVSPLDSPAVEKERWLRALEPFAQRTAPISGNGAPATAARFESLWRHCSRQERLTLIHVFQEGFANPQQEGVVERLLDKGLLKFDPNLKLMSEAFEKFVKQQASLSDVKSWEEPGQALGWKGARWIFVLVLLGAAAFLAATQESWFKGATVAMGAIAGALEVLWKLLQAVQGPQSVTQK